MRPSQRLKQSRDFARLRKEGRAFVGKCLVLSILNDPTLSVTFRAGFITSRKVGGAVMRSLMRRRLRAIVDEFAPRIVPGTMMVVIPRHFAKQAQFQDLRQDWLAQATRARILLVGE